MAEPLIPAISSGVAPRAYDIMREVEDAHWWFDAMESITGRTLDRHPPIGEVRDVLDAGCGTGRNLRYLARRHPKAAVNGLDVSPVALRHCRSRGLARLVGGSAAALPFADGSFDLVTNFDVLTARSVDEGAALREFSRVLRPGGRLFIRVAAYDFLRGRHDDEWNIGRRYRRGELREKLVRAGLRVRVASYANTLLFPVAVAKRWAEAVFSPKEETSDLQIGAGGSLTARALRAVLASEGRWVAAGALPFGLSVVALAEKPTQ